MEILLSKLFINPGYTCLDVGCSTGNSRTKIAEKVGEIDLVIGSDPDKERIGTAKIIILRIPIFMKAQYPKLTQRKVCSIYQYLT